ncbi:MAG: 5-(carboxyamino)imidazole ribonucleotide synthase [Cytophagaceae bacterium]|jgi:5-(carboxyamino)imidazole ribonucleotide synthase|nr:5-(carboxyamino)imidazole ribonucleotide synthase [Cytophagaceae bacterium]
MEHFFSDFPIGLLGGGQLGRMLIQAAVDYNLSIHVLDPDPSAPARDWASSFTVGALKDFDTVYQFGKNKKLLTIEIEHVNVAALRQLAAEGVKVYPQPDLIELIQDKRVQKEFYQKNGIPTAPFVLVASNKEIPQHAHMLPAVHKLGKEGYDGRGVKKIDTLDDALNSFTQPGLLEKRVPFVKELSVIVARNPNGEVTTFPTVEMVFHPVHNLVEYLFAPADVSDQIHQQAAHIATQVISTLQLVGVLAVELFLTAEGELLVNEIAPRPHNSGHQTIRANATSQYEQHWRAILNMPLGSTQQLCPAAMLNLLGAEGHEGIATYLGLEEAMQIDGVFPHLYGKKTTKPFRKMGHVTVLDHTIEGLQKKADNIKSAIQVVAQNK